MTLNDASINHIFRAVVQLTSDGDEQLTLMAHALVRGCRICDVTKNDAMRIIGELFDEQRTKLN